MKVYDKNIKKKVDVSCKDCLKYKCYWPLQDPGRFTQGKGYSGAIPGLCLCGNREFHGCPDNPELKKKL